MSGAVCWYCRLETAKTGIKAWLGHLVGGQVGDKGTGWAKCKGDQRKDIDESERRVLSDELKKDLREQYEEVVAAPKKRRTSKRKADEEPEHGNDDLDDLQSSRRRRRSTDGLAPGLSGAAAVVSDNSAKPRMTPSIRNTLTTLACMICYEGNIPPYSLHSNQSWHSFCDTMTGAWDMQNNPWKPPHRNDVLGDHLDECYQQVKTNIYEKANPGQKVPWVLTTDGWDNIQKLKLINFNLVGPVAALFDKIVNCDGASPTASWIKDLIVGFIEERGGLQNFVQVIMDNTSANVNAGASIERYYRYKIIVSGCIPHWLNLVFKEICDLKYVSTVFDKVRTVVNFFNTRKTLYLPLLHKFMRGEEGSGQVYALLGYSQTRFYSLSTTVRSALRAKAALVACVMSMEWEQKRQGLDRDGKAKVDEVKKICTDTGNWLRAEAIVRFLSPLVTIQLFMGKDQGDVLPFFMPMFITLKDLWDKQLTGDRNKGFAGVKHTFALQANAKLWNKLVKFDHPIYNVSCLLHPLNWVQKSEVLAKVAGYPYQSLADGQIPASGMRDDLEASFGAFIDKYCVANDRPDREELHYYLDKDAGKFHSEAWTDRAPTKFMFDSAGWWRVYGKKARSSSSSRWVGRSAASQVE